jgi:glycerophosphoryl diester phosphodiesterase
MLKRLCAFVVIGLGMNFVAAHPSGHATPLVIAHRGASFDAPENTMAAFHLAWQQNADGIEGDFYLTADNRIITLHDATFKRTAGVDRKPSDMTLAEIRQLEVGTWKGPSFKAEPVPTLEEVLATVPENKLMLIEVKCGPEIIPALKDVLAASKIPMSQLRLICFKSEVIAASKKVMPELKAYWLTSFKAEVEHGPKLPDMQTILSTLAACDADGLDAKADLEVVDELFVATLEREGYEVHFWTVDDPAVARRLAELGADSITTNRPAFLRAGMTSR